MSNHEFSSNISEVAEKIYEAATDNTDQLRYPIGADLIQVKKQMSDEAYYKMIANQFGL